MAVVESLAIRNFRNERSVGRSSVVGRSVVNIYILTLISYTPLRYVRNVAKRSKNTIRNNTIQYNKCMQLKTVITIIARCIIHKPNLLSAKFANDSYLLVREIGRGRGVQAGASIPIC